MRLSGRTNRTTTTIWIGCGIIVYSVYRHGLHDVATGHVAILANLGSLALYVVIYLGIPIAFWAGLHACVVAGALQLVSLAALVVHDLRSGDEARGVRSSAWYGLAVFAVLGAVATAPNRLGLGFGAEITSTRYILISMWLPIALVALAAIRLSPRIDRRTLLPNASGALMLVVIILTGVSAARGVIDWRHFSAARHADVDAIARHDWEHLAPYFGDRQRLVAEARTFTDVLSQRLNAAGTSP